MKNGDTRGCMSRDILLSLIDSNPRQARRHFAGIQELSASIRAHGLLEPLVVRPVGERFEIIAGERRWRAATLAGLDVVPVQVRHATDAEAYELGIVENVQRESLTPIEEAEAYQRLQEAGRTQKQIATIIGKTQSYVAQKLRLLRLIPLVQNMLNVGSITEGHARQLLRLPDVLRHATTVPPSAPPHQVKTWADYFQYVYAYRIEDYRESVRDVEDRIDRLRYTIHRAGWLAIWRSPEEEQLRNLLGLNINWDELDEEEFMFPMLHAAKWGLMGSDPEDERP